jgi:hypothetical protein
LPRLADGTGAQGSGGSTGLMPEMRVPIWLNRPLMPWPRVLAPAAIATATNTISKAYSVAVAPRSLRRKCLIKSDMRWVLSKWVSRRAFRRRRRVHFTL